MLSRILNNIWPPLRRPKVYIEDYNGITAHLETLALAFSIQKAYKHEIVIDWRELDALKVEGTIQRRLRILYKIGALRLRECDKQTFEGLCRQTVICRSENGPEDVIDPIYLETSQRVRIRNDLADKIVRTFHTFKDRPVVGLHIRRGDFSLMSDQVFDPAATQWPAVPLWWYEKVMDALLKRQKNLKFFMSATGDRSGYQYLTDKFDVFMLDIPSPYTWKGWAHQSEVHPVADLFALACCPVILATPVSGFSHWAANVLGKPSMSLIPLKGATNNMPATGMLSLYGRRINTWRAACRGELQEAVKIFSFDDPIQCTSAVTEWLEADTHRF